ncbi:ABC transporter substrate-binding protein [Dictyobacter vulcani]|uniref:ABC transporter substrate-binding protein n=1 Tax=Dictyobacter vulcani TaxID=2607529 RepID=UPI001386C52C|nr:ABC transporter substrate-binding protein [Dictyobacter vulcani]
MKRIKLISGAAIIMAGIVIVTSLFFLFNKPTTSRADATCIQYGAFLHNVSFIEAQQQGFFAKQGLNVCYNQVTSSTQQFNSLLSGQYDIVETTADNAVNRYVNSQIPVQIESGIDKGAGLDLIVNTANGINSIADLKGKSIAVDAPDSGYVFAMEKILAANGLSLSNGDYSLQIIGGSLQRFQAISAGKTSTGDPVYATILGTPFSEQAHYVSTLKDVAQLSSSVSPYQGATLVTTRAYAQANKQTMTNFIAAMAQGYIFAANPANQDTVIADIATADKVSTQVATDVYNDSIKDTVRGEGALSNQGLINTINLRQQFGGFTAPVNAKDLIKPGKNSLYDDEYWNAAIKQLG